MANDLRKEQRYAEALKIIVPLAQKSHLEAQLILVEMYLRAEGLQKTVTARCTGHAKHL